MVADRTELNKKLNIDSYFPPFFSALIPELGRPQYAIKCVEALIEQADMPIEIIMHDDGSGFEKQMKLYNELRGKISTLILNMGHNAGLARGMNRCKDMASSKYLLGFNSDVYCTSSFLKKMKTALELPYVGIVNTTREVKEGPGVYVAPDGTKIGLSKGLGICHCFGIRKEVWEEVGGWDENVQTTASDVGFVGNVFGHGYYTVYVEGTTTNEMWPISEDGKINISGTNPDYIDSAPFTRNDNNVPPLFGMTDRDHAVRCEKRREDIWCGVNNAQNAEELYPQWYNGKFQCDQIGKMYKDNGFIDWEFAKEYGHDKFKNRIIEDFKLG